MAIPPHKPNGPKKTLGMSNAERLERLKGLAKGTIEPMPRQHTPTQHTPTQAGAITRGTAETHRKQENSLWRGVTLGSI